MRDFYRILGIPDNATMADIKSAYRRLAKQYHPDLNPGSRHSEEKFKEILDAYTILSDEELRAQYDRKRRFGTSGPFIPNSSAANGPEKKRDKAKREYPPEYIEMMRQRNRARIVKQIKRRKKLLYGMIITFPLYLIAAAYFEHWIHQRDLDSHQAYNQQFVSDHRSHDSVADNPDSIADMASPYDNVFGNGVFSDYSPNQIVVINPSSDALICLTQVDSPYATIRNEFVHGKKIFFMKQIPNGNYRVKVYTGKHWDTKKKIPDGRPLGGFSDDEKFFYINRKPISLIKPTYNNPNTKISDTVRVDTSGAQIREIQREEFFKPRAQ